MKNEYKKLITFGIILFAILNIYFFAQADFIKEQITFLQKSETEFLKQKLNDSTCPDSVGGNSDAVLQMKYFYTKFCPWCKKEEPILNRLLETHGSLFYIEWYDLTKCQEEGDKYDVPTFVFGKRGEETTYTKYGFIPEKDIIEFVCNVYGGCIEENRSITLKW